MSQATLLTLAERQTTTLRWLAAGQINPVALHARLTEEIAPALSPAHAALFAQPFLDGDQVAWRTPGERVRGFSALGANDRQALTTAISGILSDIRRLVERGVAPAVAAHWPGIREVPDLDCIFVVDGRPVLAAWGYVSTRAQTPPGLLARFDDGVSWVPPPRFPARTALMTVGALCLLAIIAGVLMPVTAAWLFPVAAQCEIDPGQLGLLRQGRDLTQQNEALQGELARLEEERGRERMACALPVAPPKLAQAPPPPPPPKPLPPPAPPPNPDAERAKAAGGKTGKLQIILAWDDINDLDLYVTCPNGERTGPQGNMACGGKVDIDANRGGSDMSSPNLTRTPAENAVWDDPMPGRYTVGVVACCGSLRVPSGSRYRVTIRQQGQPDRVISGFTATPGQSGNPITVATVDIPP